MKTLLLGTSLIVATGSALAQGTITFANATSAYGATTPDHLVRFHLTAGAALGGALVSTNAGGLDLSTLRAQLFYGASTISAPGSLTAVPMPLPRSALQPRLTPVPGWAADARC